MANQPVRDFLQDSDPLFAMLAEQVKLPFIHIKQAVELARTGSIDASSTFDDISLSTQAALRLIDGYLMSVRLQAQSRLDLEPVPLSSVLYDTADQLSVYAAAHNCVLELDIKGRYAPVMAHRPAVQAALLSLGYSFIDAASLQEGLATVTLGAQRTAQGIAAGVFSRQQGLSSGLLRQARQLAGQARQPLSGFTAGNSAGIFVADALFGRLDSSVRVAHFKGMQGLAATLLPSRQLSLV
jgi:hypothetical protein